MITSNPTAKFANEIAQFDPREVVRQANDQVQAGIAKAETAVTTVTSHVAEKIQHLTEGATKLDGKVLTERPGFPGLQFPGFPGPSIPGFPLPPVLTPGESPSSTGKYDELLDKASGITNEISTIQEEIAGLDASDPEFQTKMFQLQNLMQTRQQIFTLISNLMKSEHDAAMAVINNIR